MKHVGFVFVFLLFILGTIPSESNPIVQIYEGSIRGTTLTSVRSNRTFFAFMGIPYAKPPVGDLRFKVRKIISCSALKHSPSFLCILKKHSFLYRPYNALSLILS
jgi:hypothetical protein